ncbi:hypothetical protein FACS1894132_08430 [Clostridia bacterium]|nr:hypothetical protein FACS1894132_08430 [Clostridia bacterium]
MDLAIIFGGTSTEHDISLLSAENVIKTVKSMNRYDLTLIGITKKGKWLLYSGDVEKIGNGQWEKDPKNLNAVISPDAFHKGLIIFEKDTVKFKRIDVVFPVLHGKNGEDGTIQGLFEMAGIPYVGCGVLASANCMNKLYTHMVLDQNGIKTSPYISIKTTDEIENICKKAESDFGYPLYVKPVCGGSSIGITKAVDYKTLIEGVNYAFTFDKTAIIEKNINSSELRVGVLGSKGKAIASKVGEIFSNGIFCNYEAKYFNDSIKKTTNAEIDEKISEQVREIAIKAFNVLDCEGLARIDFFLTEDNTILINEVNTLPGFTAKSAYHMLFEESGFTLSNVCETLIHQAYEKFDDLSFSSVALENRLGCAPENKNSEGFSFKWVYKKRQLPYKNVATGEAKTDGYVFFAMRSPNVKGGSILKTNLLYDNMTFAEIVKSPDCVAAVTTKDFFESNKKIFEGKHVYISEKQERLIAKAFAMVFREKTTTKIVAVTGSVGKTTTCAALSSIFYGKGTLVKSSSANSRYAIYTVMTRLACFPDYAVIECCGHTLYNYSITQDIRPDIAIVTNTSLAHAKELNIKTPEEMVKLKTRVCKGLVKGGYAVINRDMPLFSLAKTEAENYGANVVSYGYDENADAKILSSEITKNGQVIDAEIFGEKITFTIPLLGKAIATNYLAAMTAAKLSGISLEYSAERIKRTQVAHRQQLITLPYKNSSFLLIDDAYNAQPESVFESLDVLSMLDKGTGRKVAVIGDVVAFTESPHDYKTFVEPILNAKIDLLILVGELIHEIIAPEIREKGIQIVTIPQDLEKIYKDKTLFNETVQKILNEIQPQDVVLIKATSRGNDNNNIALAIVNALHSQVNS